MAVADLDNPASNETNGDTGAAGGVSGGLSAAQDDADQNLDSAPVGSGVQTCGCKPLAASSGSPVTTTFIEIELVDEDGNPVAGESFEITLPDGSVVNGTLNDQGQARVQGIDPPGSCQITFPDLDKDAWGNA